MVDGEAPDQTLSLADVEGADPDFDAAAAAAEVSPDDMLTLIYTSGTTGHPKGVQLTHRAIMFTARTIEEVIEFQPGSQGHLLAAVGPHRRAQCPPLHPGHLRRHRHLRAQSARGPVLPAPGAAQLVLRGATDLGEAQGRPGGDAGSSARGAAPARAGGARGVNRARAAAPAGRAGSRRARTAGRRSRREPVLQAPGDARPRPGAGRQRGRRTDARRRARVLPRAGDRAR